jgi:hypothetical protein
MTEQEWLTSTVPEQMFASLRAKSSERKLRLYGCACCRIIWSLLRNEHSRKAIELVERFVEGDKNRDDLAAAQSEAANVTHYFVLTEAHQKAQAAERAAAGVARPTRKVTTLLEEMKQVTSLTLTAERLGELNSSQPFLRRCNLLRCIFGNPFRPTALDAQWLTPTVTSLAASIYERRAFEQMPVLGDALEESGCSNEEVLKHCRSGDEHVRGCWVVDKVLGRE